MPPADYRAIFRRRELNFNSHSKSDVRWVGSSVFSLSLSGTRPEDIGAEKAF